MRIALGIAALLSFGATAAPRMTPLSAGEQSAEQREIAAQYSRTGMTNAVATYVRHPALARAALPYIDHLLETPRMPRRDAALLFLRTAWLTRSSYLWAHLAVRARHAGLGDADLRRIAEGPTASGWSPFEAALLDAADELHVDTFVQDSTWATLAGRYDVNQLVELAYGVGELTMHAGLLNTLGVELEPGLRERFPAGVPYTVAAEWTNERLIGKTPRIPPLELDEMLPEVRKRLDPTGSGRRIANVFRTFVRDPSVDALRGSIGSQIRDGTTLTPRQRELLLMRVGVLCRSEYEWAAHMRAGKRVGMTDADVLRIVAGPEASNGDALETQLMRAADELFRDDVVSDATWTALAQRLDTRQLLDMLVAVGGYRTASMAINSAGVQLDADMADFRFPPSPR
jgi:4-carboxymuconolactone decarboxylase